MSYERFRILLVVSIILWFESLSTFAVEPLEIQKFLAENCLDCHSGADAESGLDLKALRFDAEDSTIRQRWISIHDRVASGEMPPRDSVVLAECDRAAFLEKLSEPLIQAVRSDQRANGRGVVRRLNRVEYETALSDLLDIPLRIRLASSSTASSVSSHASI